MNDTTHDGWNRYDLMLYLYGAPVFAAGLLSLRCFLRSRLAGGSFFLFCAIVLAFLVDALARNKRGKPGFGAFARFGVSFTVVAVPAIILVFLGVFHPAWIVAGIVFLFTGHLLISLPSGTTGDSGSVLAAICLTQLVLIPLYLLLYFTGAAVSFFFIWLFPVYSVLVSAGFGVITSLIPVRILAPVLAVISMVSVITGLLSEYIL